MKKFECSRCDKKKNEIECVCQDCVGDIQIWTARLIFRELDEGIGFVYYNKIKNKWIKCIKEVHKDKINKQLNIQPRLKNRR